jgi:hypothetical protein
MPTKSYTLIPYHLRVITFKVKEKLFFATVEVGQQSFGVQKNNFFE